MLNSFRADAARLGIDSATSALARQAPDTKLSLEARSLNWAPWHLMAAIT
jgi:hypothetical protein